MRIKYLLLYSLLVVVWGTRIYAQADDSPRADPVILTDEQDSYPLGLHLEILEDPSGELTIEDVASPEYSARFAPSETDVPNFGFTDSAYWVRFQLDNQTQQADEWLLEIGFANTQYVDLYSPSPNGEGYSVKKTGALRHVSTRDILFPRIVFDLTLPAQSQQTHYLRFQSGASMTLPLTLWSAEAFLAASQPMLLQDGIFFGIMLGLLAYNLFLLFTLRELSYLYLALFLASMILFESSYSGYLETYLFPSIYFLRPIYVPLLFSSLIVSPVLFSHAFLEVKNQIPRFHRAFLVILGIWGILVILAPFIGYYSTAILMVPLALPSLLLILAAGILSWRQGYLPARYFMIAWFGLLITFTSVILVRLGILPSLPFLERAYHLGVVWMAVCWSIALADRINLLKSETERANRDLRNSEHRLSEILEALPIGVVVYGSDSKPHYANRRVTEILGNPAQGIEPDVSAGRTLTEAMSYYAFRVAGSDQLFPLEEMPVYRALQGEPASTDEIEADLVDRRVPLEIWASPVRDDAGSVESAVVAFQDITLRKRAEMALRASETRFRAVVENTFDGIVFMARDRQVLYVSPAYSRFNGMSIEEMVGKSGVNFVYPDDRARIAQAFAALLQEPGNRTTVEYRSKHQDGSWFWVETNAINLLDDPHVQAVVLNIRNIAERKESEAKLAEYQRSLELLVAERTAELSTTNERLSHEIIEREALETLLHQHIEWLRTLNDVRQSLGGSTDLPQAYNQLAATILSLLNVQAVFLIDWGNGSNQIEAICRLSRDATEHKLEGIAAVAKHDSPLRTQLEPGRLIHLSAEQAAALPAPLGNCFRNDGFNSLVMLPLVSRQSVSGVLGVAARKPLTDLDLAWTELLETIAGDLAVLAENAQLLDQAQALVAAEERNRLARDLHDSVTQVLFSASLVSEVLPQIWRRDPERAMQSLEELRRLTRGALAEMRTLLLELRPATVIKTPLHELLAQLTEAVTGRVELSFELFVEQIPPLPEEVHTGFYRIAQEALNNVVKHAQATRVSIRLSAARPKAIAADDVESAVMLVIEDDGVGFPTWKQGQIHLGISIMHERAAAIRADLSIESQPGYGTCLTLKWPGTLENPL